MVRLRMAMITETWHDANDASCLDAGVTNAETSHLYAAIKLT